MELEEQRYGRNKSTVINHTYIESGEYRRKFDKISDNKELNRLLYQLAKKMLIHRSGTNIEDMYWIDPEAVEIVAEEVNQEGECGISYSDATERTIKKYNSLITIHSHPNGEPPSANDFYCNYIYNYALGVVACHDGKVFIYKSDTDISVNHIAVSIMGYRNLHYSDYDSQILAIKELGSQFDGKIIMKEMI